MKEINPKRTGTPIRNIEKKNKTNNWERKVALRVKSQSREKQGKQKNLPNWT